MVNENIKPSNDFAVPYYAYATMSAVSVAANSYVNKTLTFSSSVSWSKIVITAEFQANGAMVNITPYSDTVAYVTVVNHKTSAISGTLRVRALMPANVTMSLS
ncbi:MAG: hypothetical protein IIW75_08630 [Bacteroidaceae bacterium]|nr:hypothetical protein [Bacteroidaceae bacterium]